MRLKFVLTLLIFTGAILGAAFYWKRHSQILVSTPAGPVMVQSATPMVKSAPNANPASASSIKIRVPASQPRQKEIADLASPASASSLTPEQRQTLIDSEVERLQQLAMNDDPASLKAILADLRSPEKEIRSAATDAAVNFGSQDAIPDLKAAANATDDIPEKIALLDAAQFLSLPSVTFGPPAAPTAEQIQADALKHSKRHPPFSQKSPVAPATPSQ